MRLQLMGDVRVRNGAGADMTPRSRKGMALVAVLALTPGNSAGRDRVLGLLWGDRGEEQARASLRQTVVDLKTTAPGIGSLIVSTRQALALHADGWSCDVGELESALAARDPALLAAQLQTVRGELLQSLQGLTDAFDDWLLAERAGRRERLVMAATAMAQAPAADPEATRQLATALMHLDPGNEDVCRLGMQLDSAAGDLAALHRRYRVLEEQLAREFSAKPSPETTKLLRELTAIRPAAAEHPGASALGVPDKAEPPLLLVTPLSPLDEARETHSVGMILAEELETTLARYRELRVLAVARPDPERLEALTHGSVASYMLGGSIRSAETTVRVNVRLSDVGTGRVVWSRRVDIQAGALGAAVDELVDQVVGAVLPAVQRDLLSAAPAASAYAYYYGGLEQLFARKSYEGLRAAADLFEKALARDSRNLAALLRLAELYNTGFRATIAGGDQAGWREKACGLTREALRLDPDSSQAHAAMGWCHLRGSAHDAAAGSFNRAVDLMPNNADILEMCAFGIAHLGEVERADELMQKAFQLNPFPTPDYFADNAVLLTLSGRFRDAVWQFGEVTDQSLHYLAVKIAAQHFADEHARAQSGIATLRDRFGEIWVGPSAPTDDDVRHWIDLWLPLRKPGQRAVIHTGLAGAGLRITAR